ncbi:DUF1564 family protein [Leptospira langatensis]|uniref:DUF1564 family protein n=1 Tax=Leptospira langatensis TaxID=2484983 RepID=A0A5F1ZPX0_9LEPT|nr:DUF1564 family protein [Leptospira langatensis]TGK01754.1 DUF1564 family protein [Leptospira langatensis]TGL39360.1 DUF1564 family protein [Leptospira langatensis]
MSRTGNKHTFYKSTSQSISVERRPSRLRPVSTLLIPPHLEKFVRKQGVTRLLKETLRVQRNILKTPKRINSYSTNTRYQRMREKLLEERYVKFNFRPEQNDWAQLRNLALSHGVSMCYLFVFLVEEYKGKQFSSDANPLWQIKAAICLNTRQHTFFRELWILEYSDTDYMPISNKRAPAGPKLAS